MSFDNFNFRILCEEDYEDVLEFTVKNFTLKEPISVCLNMTEEEGRTFFKPYIKHSLWQKVSIGAFDKTTGELVAIRISFMGKHRDKLNMGEDTGEPAKSIQQFSKIIAHVLGSDVGETLGTHDYLQFSALATREDYGKRGLGAELYRRSVALAEREGCKKMFTFASSEFTIKIATKLGYEIEKEVFYQDYVDPISGERVFQSIPPPHARVCRVVKTLP